MSSTKKNIFSFRHETPIGELYGVINENYLHSLSFNKPSHDVTFFKTPLALIIIEQLTEYFSGNLKTFNLPIFPIGTEFQKRAWEHLINIPYGETITYEDLAKKMFSHKGFQAVGNANAKNPIVLIVPCHRVIKKDGSLGGYAYGIHRKEWLLDHEKKFR